MKKRSLFVRLNTRETLITKLFALSTPCKILLIILFFSLFLKYEVIFADAAERSSNSLTVRVSMRGNMVTAADFNISDLEAMKQTRQVYSSVDPMPAPCMTLAQGIMLSDFLKKANINIDNVKSIKLSSSDGWSHTYARELLFGSERYYFPSIVKGWDSASSNPPEFLPGTEDDKKLVKPMLALKTFQERFNTSVNWSKIKDTNGIMFCFGQKNIAEKSMLYYGKYINKIDVVIEGADPFISLDSSVNGQYFKPGSTVLLKGIAQGIESVLISVADPDNKFLVSEKTVDISKGTYAFNFPLARDALEGKYKISISPKENPAGYRAEFMINVSKSGAADQDSGNTGENGDSGTDSAKPKRAGGSSSGVVGDPADTLTVMVGYFGGPYMTKKVFTLEDMQQMPQVKQAYTFIDNMPAVVIDSAIGVKITDILESSGIDVNSVESFYFYCSDVTSTWYETLPKSYLLDTKRFYYPNLPSHWNADTESATSGAKAGAVEVDAIIAIEDNWQRFAVKPDFTNMDTSTRFRLMFGQTDTSTRTASRSAKWIHGIEVMLGGTPPSGVTLDKTALSLEVGSTFQLTPSIGVVDRTTDKRLHWSSSDPSVVQVDSKGRIKVLGEGTATITVATVVGNKTAVCVVNGPKESDHGEPVSEPEQIAASSSETNINDKNSFTSTNPNSRTNSNTKNSSVKAKTAPHKNKHHLTIKKEGMTEEVDAGVQPWRVYEMSENAVALPNIKNKNILTPYTGVGAMLFFLLGAVTRMKKYISEV